MQHLVTLVLKGASFKKKVYLLMFPQEWAASIHSIRKHKRQIIALPKEHNEFQVLLALKRVIFHFISRISDINVQQQLIGTTF